MKNKKITTNLIILLFIFVGLLSYNCSGKKTKDIKIRLDCYEINDGWGYNILVNDKVFIHQEAIPCVQGALSFKSKEDAEKVGKLMIEKIRMNKVPGVSLKELKELGIKEAQ